MPLLINHLYRFGEFTVDADQRVLLRQGKPLVLAPKVLETLLTLVQNGGRIIEKEELMKRLWPDTFVEESNLTYCIVQLRKTLGDQARHPRYIETIPKRGYRFIVDVEHPEGRSAEITEGRVASIAVFRWTPDGTAVAFIDNSDGPGQIWALPSTGGPSKQLTNFTTDSIFWFDWSRDGKQLAVARGTQISDVVLISDFR